MTASERASCSTASAAASAATATIRTNAGVGVEHAVEAEGGEQRQVEHRDRAALQHLRIARAATGAGASRSRAGPRAAAPIAARRNSTGTSACSLAYLARKARPTKRMPTPALTIVLPPNSHCLSVSNGEGFAGRRRSRVAAAGLAATAVPGIGTVSGPARSVASRAARASTGGIERLRSPQRPVNASASGGSIGSARNAGRGREVRHQGSAAPPAAAGPQLQDAATSAGGGRRRMRPPAVRSARRARQRCRAAAATPAPAASRAGRRRRGRSRPRWPRRSTPPIKIAIA